MAPACASPSCGRRRGSKGDAVKRPAPATKPAGISSEAVKQRTGKGWDKWFAILDAAGAATMRHKEIATLLHERHGVPGWWSQMVTVGYEQAWGLRQKHQTTEGYQASASKTYAVPVAKLYAAWAEPKARARWLGKPDITVSKTTPEQSLRGVWKDGKTRIDANFWRKGEAKSQVTISHLKLADAAEVARVKAQWKEALERLRALLEA